MKRTLLAGFFLLFAFVIQAQQDRPMRDGGKLQELKKAYIRDKLNLTTEEEQKFWPIYAKYSTEIRQVYLQYKDGDEVVLEEKIVDIRKKYKSQFATVISDQKVSDFFKADKEFNNIIQREMIKRRQQQKQNQTQNNK